MQPHKSNTLPPPLKTDVKDKNVEIDNRNKDSKKKSPPVKCDKCQGYGHIVDKCTNLFRVIINRVPTATPESDNTIHLVTTPMITEFSDVPNESQDKHHQYVTLRRN